MINSYNYDIKMLARLIDYVMMAVMIYSALEDVKEAYEQLYGKIKFPILIMPIDNRIAWLPSFEWNRVKGYCSIIENHKTGKLIVKDVIINSTEPLDQAPITLAHELSHAINADQEDNSNHGPKWQKYFNEIMSLSLKLYNDRRAGE